MASKALLGRPWISWGLLLLAYLTYGRFLHDSGAGQLSWGLSVGFAIATAGIFTLFWVPARRVILLGFKSDVGYSVMVLVLASLAVLALVQFRVTSYMLVLIATSLLARVDTLIVQLNGWLSFLLLTLLPLAGLGLSWLLAAAPS